MTIYMLGPFRLDTQDSLLYRDKEPVALGRRAIALLRTLIDRPGAVVAKERLIEAAWPCQAVEENNLTVQIAALRRVLGEAPGGKRWIATIPRRGYRYVGPVNIGTESDLGTQHQGSSPLRVGPTPHDIAEYRPITALSCEISSVTAGADRMSLDDLRRAIPAFHHFVRATAERFDGFVARYLGNRVLVVFGYPAANERDAEQAVRAGLALCAAVRAGEAETGVAAPCRIGIATGAVIAGGFIRADDFREHEFVGGVPDLAAALQMSTQPGTVVIDSHTRRLIGRLYDCRDLGPITPGFGDQPTNRWQVLGEKRVESRFEALHGLPLSPLVGREEEVELLLRRWVRAKAEEGQVVLISGEPGIGKSRIAAALEERLRAEPHQILRFYCSPHHQDSALYPFVDHLVREAEFAQDDTPAQRFGKIRGLLKGAALTEEDVALLAELLSLPALDRSALPGLSVRRGKQRTLDILIRHLEASTLGQPSVLLFEDAHWIDPTSYELLDLLIPRLCSLPTLMLVTFRPEFQPPWAGQPQVTALMLGRLSLRDRVTLVRQVAGGKALPREVLDQISDRADGVPLFVEELTKNVLESGVLLETTDRYVLDRPLPSQAIPSSLHALLMARLDRLEAVRHVAQICAALGREFSYRLVHAVSQTSDDALQAALAQLVTSGLLFQRGVPPDAVYIFKHVLLQDAAHESLLHDRRQHLHAEIAKAMEAQSPELQESQPELFAQHYAEAGLVEQSVDYWGKAGRRSVARSTMAEAAAQFQRALDQLALLPSNPGRQRQELEFYIALGAALQTSKGLSAPETGGAYARAREFWERLGSPAEYLRAPMGQSAYHTNRGELELAQQLNAHFLHLAHQRNEPRISCMAHMAAGRTLTFTGSFEEARSHLEKADALYDQIPFEWTHQRSGLPPRVATDGYLATVLLCLGYVDQAMAKTSANIAHAQGIAHTPSMTLAHVFGATLFSLLGEDQRLHGEVQRLVSLAEEHDFALYLAQGAIFRGQLNSQDRESAEGLRLIDDGLHAYRSIGSLVWVPLYLDILAGAYETMGQVAAALIKVDEALQIAGSTGEQWFIAELHRHKGQLLVQQGEVEGAERQFLEALRIAQAQGARLWELRAVMSLARLRHDQGRRAEAYESVRIAYSWFTEGFATSDLRAARELLDELRE